MAVAPALTAQIVVSLSAAALVAVEVAARVDVVLGEDEAVALLLGAERIDVAFATTVEDKAMTEAEVTLPRISVREVAFAMAVGETERVDVAFTVPEIDETTVAVEVAARVDVTFADATRAESDATAMLADATELVYCIK